MMYSNSAIIYLAMLFATPAEGKWDFNPAGNGFDKVACRILAITASSVTVSKIEAKNEVVVYPFHLRLAHGSYNLLEPDAYCYTRTDLKVGDIAVLRILKPDKKQDYCVSFSITERENGKVPPTRRYRLGDWQPYHERVEAFRAFEHDKIPLPLHLGFKGRPYMFPAFDTRIPRQDRIKPWPAQAPLSYIEFALFMR